VLVSNWPDDSLQAPSFFWKHRTWFIVTADVAEGPVSTAVHAFLLMLWLGVSEVRIGEYGPGTEAGTRHARTTPELPSRATPELGA
jgi:hypothetical protein